MTITGKTTEAVRAPMNTRRIATITGWLMVVTFVTSIPAYFIFYAPVRSMTGRSCSAQASSPASRTE
ncbi:hypothetical protein [Blastococcus deserti]|uniref:Uncharacterized protein n=1 Tax=Blastococcus deserti TaxID=2259033 RepID=A0ABW4XCG6_9ACTN